MSELTQCNYCSLQAIRKRAEKREATVTVEQNMEGWQEARVSDSDEPVAYFMELTTHCVC